METNDTQETKMLSDTPVGRQLIAQNARMLEEQAKNAKANAMARLVDAVFDHGYTASELDSLKNAASIREHFESEYDDFADEYDVSDAEIASHDVDFES
jgi:hypothetical protein